MRHAVITGTLIVAIYLFSLTLASSSGNWDLRRNVGDGACFIQPSDSSSIGELLQTHSTRKEACDDAKSRYTDDAADKSKCFTYTTGTKDECKKEGVDLKD